MIYHGGVVDDDHIPGFIHIVIADIRAADILVRNKIPVMGRRHVSGTICHVKAYAGTHGCPSVILIVVTPCHPGRCIFVTRDPHPAITVLEKPAAIVESSPTPVIIGSPGPPLIGIDPVTIGGIGLKIGTHFRHPDIAVTGVVYPLSIRTQIIIK
jgi:hypothetical protein